jgi:hypothetical protein
MKVEHFNYIKYSLAGLLLVLTTGSEAIDRQKIDINLLTGNISLTLKHGLWKEWEQKPVFQDITIDLVCDRGQCEPEVWAFAPSFNKDVDHSGKVEIIAVDRGDGYWRLKTKMGIQSHPGNKTTKPAEYNIKVVLDNDRFLGSYSGNYSNRRLNNKVTGNIAPHYPIKIANFRSLQPQEHPRLMFRRQQLPELQEKAKTEAGKIILAQLKQSLQQKVYYNNAYVPNGGYHAVGHCFLYQIEGDKKALETAWQITDNAMQNPGRKRILEQSTTVAGIAMTFDLCYDGWTVKRRKQVAFWLNNKLRWLIAGDSPKNGWNSYSWSNWNARARGAAGLAALVLLNEPKEFFGNKETKIEHNLKVAERNIIRYLQMAIGDRGFGTEGDLYSTEPWTLTVMPFLLGYRNTIGEDLISNSSAEWFLPHYILRLTGDKGKLSNGAFGRHYLTPSGSLFAVGLPLVKQEFLPAVMWFFDRNFGMNGDRSFGIGNFLPYEAIYAFLGYPNTLKTQNPADAFGKVLEDKQKGFYVFRNRFQDSDDFVASIYLQKQPLHGSWSFPDVGSFRILGFGEQWASFNLDTLNRENENVVIVNETKTWDRSSPLDFIAKQNGSGIITLKTNTIANKKSSKNSGLVGYRSFAVDYSETSGSPALFVITDNFIGDNSATNFKNKKWVMNTQGKVTLKPQGFIIQGDNGATMEGTFVEPIGVHMSVKKTKTGTIIQAMGGDFFFVVMTVQKGTAPKIIKEGSSTETKVTVGKQIITYRDNKIILEK